MAEMSKTPEEIKKGLKCAVDKKCVGKECLYFNEEYACIRMVQIDVLALIQQLERDKSWASENYDLIREENKRLEAQNAELSGKIRQLELERDAAIADMRNANICICLVCANFNGRNPAARKNLCKEFGELSDEGIRNILSCGGFKWRGPCEENTENP